MKVLITVFILFSSSVFADVYYCGEEESTGFIPSENFRKANYKIDKYTIKVNLEKLTIVSDEIGMPEGYSTCRKYYYHENVLELNASDDRGLSIINNTIIPFCQKMTNSPEKLIILDEADSITNKAQNLLSNIIAEYKKSCRFVFRRTKT